MERLRLGGADFSNPWDDEPTTKEDLNDLKKAKEAFNRGETIKLKDVLDELLH